MSGDGLYEVGGGGEEEGGGCCLQSPVVLGLGTGHQGGVVGAPPPGQ